MSSVTVHPSPVVKSSIIVLSWPCKASWEVLNALKTNSVASPPKKNGEIAILYHSLIKAIEFKLSSGPSDEFKTKFTTISHDVHSGHAIVVLTTQPTFSAVRKVLTVVSKNFVPGKTMAIYKKFAQNVGFKADPSEFAWAVDEFNSGAKSIKVFVTGGLKVDAAKTKLLQSAWSVTLDKAASKAKAPVHEKEDVKETKETALSCGSRLECFMAKKYLASVKIDSQMKDGSLVPVLGRGAWDTVKSKYGGQEKLAKFVQLKLLKLKDKLADSLRVICAAEGYFTAQELAGLPSKYTETSLVALLKKHF